MASTALMPVEEYLRNINERPSYEYIDGALIEKPMGSILHGILQMWFGHLFARYPNYAAASEVHSRLRETEFRLPDVAVQRREIALSEPYAQTPLVLAIEILSPGDKLGATFAKCELYHHGACPIVRLLIRTSVAPGPIEQATNRGSPRTPLKQETFVSRFPRFSRASTPHIEKTNPTPRPLRFAKTPLA